MAKRWWRKKARKSVAQELAKLERSQARQSALDSTARILTGARADYETYQQRLAQAHEALTALQGERLRIGAWLDVARGKCPEGQWRAQCIAAGWSTAHVYTLRAKAVVPGWQDAPLAKRITGKQHAIALRLATPPWQDLAEVEAFYVAAEDRSDAEDVDYDVDHIHPLRPRGYSWREGDAFIEGASCGLHVPWNLQLLAHEDNMAKGNRITDDLAWVDD